MDMDTSGEIKRFFWDVDFSNLDKNKDRDFIVERLLEMGDEKSTNWLFSVYDKKAIREILKKSKKITPKSANYWALILEISPTEILCLKKRLLTRPETIWKY